MSVRAARNLSVHTILSGPAGGAVGGFESGKRAGFQNVISFDMGGTSTDVSLAAGALSLTSEGSIGELPVRVPIIDIHTVGAGGGSIAFRDPGGSLRVGPRSAGADPGPICYGRGGKEVTVTDANLFLGRLSAHHFLGGTQVLDARAARDGIVALAEVMGLDPDGAADGIIRVANATMERAIRVISLERGHDPRDFALVCFGGAGGMHAAELARGLGIPRVVVPPAAGILSALGMLLADFARDYSRTLLTPLDAAAAGKLALAFAELEKLARGDCESEGVDVDRLAFERSLDMRYVGQGYELTVAWNQAPGNEFNRLHEQRYGYADKSRALEVVNVRLRARGTSAKPAPEVRRSSGEDASVAVIDEVVMLFDSLEMRAPLVDRALLQPGNRVMGPALVVEYSTTTVIPPDFVADMDGTGNLVLRARDA
jgi:N-methylhydantoinase A